MGVQEQFEAKFVQRSPDECWEWIAAKTPLGYGVFAWSVDRLAHRVSYRLHVGDIPEGMVIRHTCDNPSCVNPAHLLVGTQRQNMDDAIERERFAKGDGHHSAKLTEDSVREILMSERPAAEIAAEYAVHPDLIRMIQRGARWKHVHMQQLPAKTQLRREHGARGEGHHNTHLTTEDVVAIRSDRRTNRVVAAAFGISSTTVSNIKHFKQWGHVLPAPSDYRAERPTRKDWAPCSVESCAGNAAKGSRGLCRAHYHRLYRYGSATGRP